MGTAQAQRNHTGMALLRGGFRPFFLGGGLFALVAIAIWPALYEGRLDLPTAFTPLVWHGHEMLFGFGAAVVAGFLLTAIPNWTGRLPVTGPALAGLALLWLAGRAAVLCSGQIGWLAAMGVDVAFLVVFCAVVAREVLAGRNWRNLKVIALVALLALANLSFHLEAHVHGMAEYSTRAAMAITVFLILLIGGRVVPSFTGNWLARRGEERPTAFNRLDAALLILAAIALLFWIGAPEARWSGVLLLAGGAGCLLRLARWRGWRTGADPLVLVLHVAFLFTGLGFLAMGAGVLWPDILPPTASLHVWSIGSIGLMTLAMMTRATLGHSGQPLSASPGTRMVYVLVTLALVARVAMALSPQWALELMWIAAATWCAGFAGFVGIYGPMLCRPRA